MRDHVKPIDENLQRQFIAWLQLHHTGQHRAILAKDISHFGSPRYLRVLVHDARLKGYAICSGSYGYYYAETSDDIYSVVKIIEARVAALSDVLAKLRDTHQQMKEKELQDPVTQRQRRLF